MDNSVALDENHCEITQMASILLLNGPNLNLLGERESEIYGNVSLDSIEKKLQDIAKKENHDVCCFQSNAEHELVERVQMAKSDGLKFAIANPAAFTHTSIALRDAFLAAKLPFVEVHLSNFHAREPFRQQSYFSDIAEAVICGFGEIGYEVAIKFVIGKLG